MIPTPDLYNKHVNECHNCDLNLQLIVENTNIYGWLNMMEKPSYTDATEGWREVTAEEIWGFIALVIYMGFVKAPSYCSYWSTAPLYHGLWARRIMTCRR